MSETPRAAAARPPVAKAIRETSEVHGERRVDDFRWLRDKDDPDVRAYLEAENAHTDAVMRPTEALQEALYAEMLGRIQETDQDVPSRRGGFFYYSRTEQGLQYPIYCRKKGGLDAPEEVTLDLNRLAEGKPFMSLGVYRVSDDASLLAYSTDETGFRQYTLFVKDLRTGELVETVVEKVGSAAWAADDRTVFYTVEEESTKRQYRLFRHRVGEAAHELVYEEEDAAFNVDVSSTRSRQYLVLGISSLTTSEARFLPAAEPLGEWRLVAPRVPEQEYDVEHHGDVFYVRVNDAGRNFRLVKAPVTSPGRESWSEVRPHRADVMLEGVDCFAGHLVLLEREGGLPQLTVTDLGTGAAHRIAFPEAAYSAWPEANPEFETRTFRYSYQSLVTPPSVFDYDMETRATALKEEPVLGGYDRRRYRPSAPSHRPDRGEGAPLDRLPQGW
jgi:oligopeptidase B